MAKPLTPIAIANLKPRPQRYEVSDGGCAGLRVVVFPPEEGFVVRFRFRGLQRKLTLGPCLVGADRASPPTAPSWAPRCHWRRRASWPPRRCARPRAGAIRAPPSSGSARKSWRPNPTP